ncbi:MAG: hypothetical protein JO053_01520 [Acidobacteria bacterium]|nr:hypothetical protein [Acidobacteriota bacterium]
MASHYAGFTVQVRDTNGVITNVGSGISVKVRADGAGSDAAESPLTTNSSGAIAAGTLAAIAVGTKVHFRVENYGGRSGSVSQITTS